MEIKSSEKPTRPLRQIAYARIADWLISEKLQPGEPLVEMTLANRLKIGRTPVREAIQQLAQEGLVEIFPRRGAFVARTSLKDVKELFEIREALEGTAARLATLRSDQKDIESLRAQFEGAEQQHDCKQRRLMLERAGDALHDYILRTCGNNRLVQIINNHKLLLQRERHHAAMIPGRIDSSAQEHREILHALANGDATGAEKAMRRHIAGTAESVLMTFSALRPMTTSSAAS